MQVLSPSQPGSPSGHTGRFLTVCVGLLSLSLFAGCSTDASTAVSTPTPVGTAQLTLTASSFTFGVVGTGAKSALQTLAVQNSGTITASFTAPSVSGDFTQANNTCVSTLAVGSYCYIGLVFAPSATGTRTGTLTINSNAPAQTVALSGTGGTSVSNLTGTSLSFGSVIEGATSPIQTITLTDPGTAPLSISGFAVTGDFLPVSDTCANLVAISTPCVISVVFTPSALGARTGAITITSNAAGSPQTISLSGTGTAVGTSTGASLSAKVEAGTQPIAGASVQLYAAGSTGSGTGSIALGAPVTTSSAGIAIIPGGYTCPSAAALLYLVANGGTVASSGSANANIRLITALGPCSSVAAGSQYVVSDATTAAAAYALAQFYSAGSIGTSATNLVGLTNAFATASTLADPITNATPGSSLPTNAVSPAPRINAVANIVNACLVSASACAAFYSATTVTTLPTNTLDAVFNLARHPTANVATLYGQSLLSHAYSPALTAAPTDWTMFLNFSGGGMNSPSGIAVDTEGNVWVANYFYVASKFTPIGTPVFAGGITGDGLNNSYGLAIGLDDGAWIPNEQPYQSPGNTGSVTELASTGVPVSGTTGFTSGGLNYPLSVAIDPDGTVWVVDYGNSHLTLLNYAGAAISGTTGFTTPLFAFPVAVAVDANHFAWIGNQSSNTVTKVSPDGSSYANFTSGEGASGLAFDQNDNVWVANYYDNNVAYLSNSGTLNGLYTALGSIERPQGIAVDGAGNVWVTNYRAPYLNELAGASASIPGAALSPVAGIGADATLLEAYAVAIDASGNIWISNQGTSTITKFIGLATPVKTPLSGLPKLP